MTSYYLHFPGKPWVEITLTCYRWWLETISDYPEAYKDFGVMSVGSLHCTCIPGLGDNPECPIHAERHKHGSVL